MRVFPEDRASNLGSKKLWRSRSQQLWAPGRLKRVGWGMSGPLQLRSTAWRARLRPCVQAQVPEDFLDNRLFEDRRYDLQLAAAVGAVLSRRFGSRIKDETSNRPPRTCR